MGHRASPEGCRDHRLALVHPASGASSSDIPFVLLIQRGRQTVRRPHAPPRTADRVDTASFVRRGEEIRLRQLSSSSFLADIVEICAIADYARGRPTDVVSRRNIVHYSLRLVTAELYRFAHSVRNNFNPAHEDDTYSPMLQQSRSYWRHMGNCLPPIHVLPYPTRGLSHR